jgi:RND superfamily putative drug exporter
MLTTLADICFRARRLVTAGWAAILIVLVALSAAAAGTTSDDYTVPGAASEQAMTLLQEHGLHDDQAGSFRVVFQDAKGLAQSGTRAAIDQTLAELQRQFPDAALTAPFDSGAHGQVSPDGTVGYAQVQLPLANDGTPAADDLDAAGNLPEHINSPTDGLKVAFSGPMFQASAGGGPGEGIGLLLAAIILLIAFGSVLAMGLPLVVALFGAGCGITAIMLVANFVSMSSAAVPLAAMLAVGGGIDYCLFVVTRYREALSDGHSPRQAVTQAQNTAGRAVLFAGTTVVIAVLGLLTMNMPLINGVAVGAALAIAITMTASLTLLPALLGFVGTRIDRFGLPHRRRHTATRGTLAHRWSRSVQRHPWLYTAGSLVILAVLTIPAMSMRLGFPDAGTDPATATTRQAHDMLADGFGPGINGPLFAVIDGAGGTVDQSTMATLRHEIAATADVETVSPPITSPDGQVALLTITPTTGPSAAATAKLVAHLGNDVIPGALSIADPAVHGYLTGQTAAVADFSSYTADRLPVFLAVIMLLAFILLTIVFRSVVVALKAIVVNLLSIGASFGVLVAALQWGWGSGLFGLDQPIPVVAWVPMMMVAVVFGLSMDYEVFLLSRIKEHHDSGAANADAVADGLTGTARVITAAAAIMICVFASFMLGAAIDLAVFGFGLAVAVLIDATLVRMILVPAAMELFGERNWWLPKWLARRLPTPTHATAADRHPPLQT